MPFVYQSAHDAGAGEIGAWILGLVALAWTIDCFVGFYLTLPSAERTLAQRFCLALEAGMACEVLRLLLPRQFRSASRRRPVAVGDAAHICLVERLHEFERLLFARDVAALRLSRQPYYWVAGADVADVASRCRGRKRRRPASADGRGGAQAMASASSERCRSTIVRDKGALEYRVRSSRDIGDKYGQTSVWFDSRPANCATRVCQPARTPAIPHDLDLSNCTRPISSVFPTRFSCARFGLVIVMLSVTGVYIWWKKRSARRAHVRRRVARPAPAE